MAKYLIKRGLYIIPVFLVLTFLVFTVLNLAPGDPVLLKLGPSATTEQVEALTEELGLNKPLIERYVDFVLGLFRGDMGKSWMRDIHVFTEFSKRLPNTLILSLMSLCITVIVGIPTGVISAVKQNSVFDRVTLVTALFFMSLPAFFLALLAQLFFSLRLGWLPATGVDSWRNFILPVIMLSAGQIAGQTRMTRSSMLDVLSQDYIRTAYSKGAPRGRVVVRHVLRNGLLPVVTGIGNAVAHLFSGAAVIEVVFSIPGLGTMMVSAVQSSDIPMVMGPLVFSALFVCAINLLVDVAYAFIDPRVKLRYTKG